MKNIVPHLWFDKEALEAVELYMSLFEDSRILRDIVIEGTPSGDARILAFQLAGQEFSAINAGPYFTFNPSVSFMVACATEEELRRMWTALTEKGSILMPLEKYDFSPLYGWVEDRFGLSWQLSLQEGGEIRQKIVPNLLFSREVCGKAEEALKFYTEVFPHSQLTFLSRYGEKEAQSPLAKVNYAEVNLNGYVLSAMDNAMDADYTFSEAISFMVNCEGQEEIDEYWDKLSAVPEAEQCGWIKDRYGLSWQIVPADFDDIYVVGTPEEITRVTQSLLSMKKLDLAGLERARLGIPE